MTDTTFSFAQLLPALPELYLTAAVCLLLLFDVFLAMIEPVIVAVASLRRPAPPKPD